jgi:hypothetical protein
MKDYGGVDIIIIIIILIIIIKRTSTESHSRVVSRPLIRKIPDSDIDLGTAYPGICVGFFSPYRQSLGLQATAGSFTTFPVYYSLIQYSTLHIIRKFDRIAK